jgi:hypothetical protein
VIIHNFHIEGVSVVEAETNPPLLIDANAPLAFSLTFNGSSRLEGGARRSSIAVAALSWVRRIAARKRISGGIRRDLPVAKKRAVSEDANDRITIKS